MRARERADVVELHDEAGLAGRQEIRLSAAVVADDRQAERHRFEKHQAEAFVLTGRDERVGDRERGVFFRVGDLAEQVHAIAQCRARPRAARSPRASGPSPTISR